MCDDSGHCQSRDSSAKRALGIYLLDYVATPAPRSELERWLSLIKADHLDVSTLSAGAKEIRLRAKNDQALASRLTELLAGLP